MRGVRCIAPAAPAIVTALLLRVLHIAILRNAIAFEMQVSEKNKSK